MAQAVFLALIGISGSLLALAVLCAYASEELKDHQEKECIFRTYMNWVMSRGSEDQKQAVAHMGHRKDLATIKSVVGTGFLVDR